MLFKCFDDTSSFRIDANLAKVSFSEGIPLIITYFLSFPALSCSTVMCSVGALATSEVPQTLSILAKVSNHLNLPTSGTLVHGAFFSSGFLVAAGPDLVAVVSVGVVGAVGWGLGADSSAFFGASGFLSGHGVGGCFGC
jgi:hypothetical protein